MCRTYWISGWVVCTKYIQPSYNSPVPLISFSIFFAITTRKGQLNHDYFVLFFSLVQFAPFSHYFPEIISARSKGFLSFFQINLLQFEYIYSSTYGVRINTMLHDYIFTDIWNIILFIHRIDWQSDEIEEGNQQMDENFQLIWNY